MRRDTLPDQVASALLARIEALGLAPGDEIPAEGELARDFGVNRLVVREAIRTLAAREVLSPRQGRPARVTVPSGRVLGQLLDFRLRQQSLDLDDLLAARLLIECDVARRAAEQVRDAGADLGAVESSLEGMRGAVEDRDRFVALDVAFHHDVATVAGSGLLTLLLESLEEVLVRARRTTFDARARRGLGHEHTLAAHAAVLAALRAGDPQAASAAMADHLTATAEDVAAERGAAAVTPVGRASPGGASAVTRGPRTRR